MRVKRFYPIFKKASAPQPVLPSADIYKTCSELPLSVWLKVNTTKDLKYLVKSGTPDTSELFDVWNQLQDEYRRLIQNVDGNYIFDLRKEIFKEDRDLITITAIVNQLRLRRNEALIGILKNDFNFPLNYVDLNADLDRTLRQAKNRLIRLKLKEKEFTDLNGAGEEKEFTEYSFIEELTVLSEFQGYRISLSDTVIEYAAIYNRFKSTMEQKLKNA